MKGRKMTNELILEVQKTLQKIAETNPSWRLALGTEMLSATDVLQRLDKDKKLRKIVLIHYVGLAIEIEQKARQQIEGNSHSPQV